MKVIIATFTGAQELISACKKLIEKGHRLMDVHSPYPLEELNNLFYRRESPVRFWTFICGIIGLVTGFGFTIWTSLDWPLDTGGKPIVSLPPFLIIAFELTLLFGAIGTILAFVLHSKLPSLFRKNHLTGDKFGLTIIEESNKIRQVEGLLSSLGAKEILIEDYKGALPSPISRSGKVKEKSGVTESFKEASKVGKTATLAYIAMVILGLVSFAIGISTQGASSAWQIYLVNLLYWTGISAGCVLFTAILVTTKAGWAKTFGNVASKMLPFLPISLALFLITFFGKEHIFPWINQGLEENKKWFNIPFLYLRDSLGWLVMSLLSGIFIYNFRKNSHLTRLAVILIILFMFFFSLIGVDLIMGLSPEWVSTLFGGYFAIGAFYSALAFIVLFTFLSKIKVDSSELANMGELIFAFSLFWASLFWAQYLVIWYGNIPEETGFVYRRLYLPEWRILSWLIITLNFFIPFILLLGKYAKANRLIMLIVSLSITLGFFLERYILIAPSISVKPHFGFMELFISGGFLGVFLLCRRR